ncbi:MAG: hypothetical protein K5868_08140 [Lachnospiraceae bacterium]|nr:hypothetical protein [Lachnospiraceae bacterium]
MSKDKTVKDKSNNKRSALFVILAILGFLAVIAVQVVTRIMYLSDLEYEIYYAETVDAFYNSAYIRQDGLIFSNYFSVNGLYLVLLSICFKVFGNIKEVIIYFNIALELLTLICIYCALKNIFNRIVAFIVSIVVALYPLIMFMIGDYTGTVYMLLWRSDRLLYLAGAIVFLLLSLIILAIKKAHKRKKLAKLEADGNSPEGAQPETKDSDIINLDAVNVEDIPEPTPEASEPARAMHEEEQPAPAPEAPAYEPDSEPVAPAPAEEPAYEPAPQPVAQTPATEPAYASAPEAEPAYEPTTEPAPAEEPAVPVSREEYIAANGVDAADYISTDSEEPQKKKDPGEYRVVISGLNMLFENPYSHEVEYLHKPAPTPEALANMSDEDYASYNSVSQPVAVNKDAGKKTKGVDKVDLLINPLPVPKKHEPRNMEYDYDFDEVDLKYDLDIDDDAEFDYE